MAECMWCKKPIPRKRKTVEHIEPLGFGGSREWCNCGVACYYCNNNRGRIPAFSDRQNRLLKHTAGRRTKSYWKLTKLVTAWGRFLRDLPEMRYHQQFWVALEEKAIGRSPSAALKLLTEEQVEEQVELLRESQRESVARMHRRLTIAPDAALERRIPEGT